MKSIIPYTKSISFGSKIAEITSMSLEYELEKSAEEIRGNFIISGEYRSHEVSVNREPFLHKLPFSIDVTERIDLDSVNFEITDFSYDIVNDDTVEVNIEFVLEADEIEPEPIEEKEKLKEEEERSVFSQVEEPVSDILDYVEEAVNEKAEETDEKEETEKRNEDMKESEETIINNVNPLDDNYATYHIHIVKEGESVETICTMYGSNINLVTDYNDLSNINVGDKVIIPKEDE